MSGTTECRSIEKKTSIVDDYAGIRIAQQWQLFLTIESLWTVCRLSMRNKVDD